MKITRHFFAGRWWIKKTPKWISGYYPIATYTPEDE